MSEFDTGYSVVIGKPVVHAEKKATGSSVSFPCEAILDGSYLVSFEVNGSVKAYRESMDFSSGSCAVGEYTLSYSSYALTVSGTSNNDIVRVMVEPLDVKTTDAFRAAVGKVAPKSGGGSGGGGVLVVNATPSDNAITLDQTWQAIKDADAVSIVVDIAEENARNFLFCSSVLERVPLGGVDTQYVVKVSDIGEGHIMEFIASSASGYPSYTYE